MSKTIPTEVWVLMVRKSDIPYLNRNLAGLNLVERHIREAMAWNIRQVFFWLEPAAMPHDQGLKIEFERILSRVKVKYDYNFVRVIHKIEDLSVHEAELAMAAPHMSLFTPQWISQWSITLDQAYKRKSTFEQVWSEVRMLPEMDEWKEAHNPTVFYVPITQEKDWAWAQKRLGVEIVEQSRSGIVGKNINRKISLFMSGFFVQFEASPVVWTWVNVAFGILASLLMMSPSYGSRVAGMLFFYWSVIFDGVDGEVARFRFETSEKGALLDMAASWFNTLLFYGSVLFSMVSSSELSVKEGQFLLLSSSVALMMLSAYFINVVKLPIGQGAWAEWENKYPHYIRTPWLSLLYRKESFAVISLLLVLMGQMQVLVWGIFGALLFAGLLVMDVEFRARLLHKAAPDVSVEG